MRCPSCTTEVPEARFCARCGARLTEAAPAGQSPAQPATRTFLPPTREEVSSSGWGGAVAGVVAALLGVVGVSAAAGWMTPDVGLEGREVALPTAAPNPATAEADPTPVPATATASPTPPSATVVCSNLAQHRVEYALLDGAEVGAVVEVHGGPCVVTEIDADARPPDYPRGVARGNRPGTGPTPRR